MSTKIFTATISRIDEDRIFEGLRIPPSLDNNASVNFVLTQEPGKLKPKDLKIAIEKNRAEREIRAAEQKKIRDEGGGAGLLDLRGILSEERLNLVDVSTMLISYLKRINIYCRVTRSKGNCERWLSYKMWMMFKRWKLRKV
jgi:hypothetical protein